jgi:hypothetical protein
MIKAITAEYMKYLEKINFLCSEINSAAKTESAKTKTEYLFKNAKPKLIPIPIQYFGSCLLMSFKTKNKKSIQKKSSKTTGMKSEFERNIAVEIKYAKQLVKTAKPLPPISLTNRAIKIIIEEPNNAGKNFTKNM